MQASGVQPSGCFKLPGRNKKKNTSLLTASAIKVAGLLMILQRPMEPTPMKVTSASKAHKAKLVVITNLTLASQMEKLVMIMMAAA